MAVPIRLSDAVDLYDESIQRVFNGKYEAVPETYKLLCDVGNTNLYVEKRSAFTGFTQAKQLGENEVTIYESPDQGMDRAWTQRQFSLGFAVTKMLWQFDRKNKRFVLVKSFLINGENLRRKAMATLSKQIGQIKNCLIGQLQRLSEKTVILAEATVRTYAKA